MKIPRVQVQRIKYLYSILYCKLLDDAFIRCKWCIFLLKLCKLWKAALNLAYPNLSGRFLDLLWCSIKSHSNCLVNTGIKTVKLGWILRIFRILVIKIQKIFIRPNSCIFLWISNIRKFSLDMIYRIFKTGSNLDIAEKAMKVIIWVFFWIFHVRRKTSRIHPIYDFHDFGLMNQK